MTSYAAEMFDVQVVSNRHIGDLDRLFGTFPGADSCWCQWFIARVADYHAAGRDGNRAAFCDLVETSPEPVGLVAYKDGEPVGWCAAGPRERYRRAVATMPTMHGRDRSEDSTV